MKHNLLRQVALAVSITAFFPAYAKAGQFLNPAILADTKIGGLVQANFGVNGRTVQFVATPEGRFFNDGGGNWRELGNNGASFNFRETQRDDWSVYLRDDSRGVNLQLDLHRKEVIYSDDGGRKFVLYQIIDAHNQASTQSNDGGGQVGNAYSSTVVEYTCNEGIPLTLVFESEGEENWVSWTHDGFKGPGRLPNVISGSGSKYSDGRYTVWEHGGNEVYLNLDGIEDRCTRS